MIPLYMDLENQQYFLFIEVCEFRAAVESHPFILFRLLHVKKRSFCLISK